MIKKNKYSDLYQWLDKSPHKGMVAGSSPAVGTKKFFKF